MIRDRGNIKWTAMMLPEHVAKLRDWMDADGRVERPQLDDWELEAIQIEVELAYQRQCEVNVTVWREGKTVVYMGKISKLDVQHGYLSLDSPFGHDQIPVAEVIRVDSRY